MHPLRELLRIGQSPWLDFIDARLIASGNLDRLIDDGVRGVTSNPTIFQKAIAGSHAYDDIIHGSPTTSDAQVLERIMVRDVTLACDRLFRVFEATRGADGFVSIEVDPTCARDTERSIQAARRLWRAVSRPNLMVKIPGTTEGLAAVESLLALGININITLLFSVERYAEVAEAYVRALEARLQQNEPIDRISSVASFFVSRVDAKVDHALDLLDGTRHDCGSALRGRIAIANADAAYAHYHEVIRGDRWKRLATRGARPQRLLWASTSTKDPAYRDLYYVEALIAPDTVDTMTLESLQAFQDHGRAAVRLGLDPNASRELIADLASLEIDFPKILRELEDEGIAKFSESYASTLETIANERRSEHPSP